MKRQNGFTVVELMVTLIVAGILIAVAVPSLTNLYYGTRAKSAISGIESAIMFGRSQAVSFSRNVSICPGTGGGCTGDWIDGYNVILDSASNGTKDANTDALRVLDGFNDKDFIKVSTSSPISFNADGMLNGTSQITINYCPESKTSEYSKGIVVSVSGKISSATTTVNCS
ncbi:prepilin-type N-terminal cleavage/methylation domain-containing protein [Shewanella sp. WXL01]|uniref:Type II secretion system protein H n=1 Tax=Shewanella maritima TaxID=2520507 RepID=A0A411PK95_9GAMM|nr:MULTISPECIES: GspH/FimT family pseudopilin [Shewanella]NKF51002.1 prepilin-type N-terminal cleavage/methylation domain-containing protein [Shewanella sp. WXL01]QBF83963.1 prepilin-type N-terminal cleavage/methylation domain-containing protein [Shewanella maritima]